ncbi:MAG: tetratricopeptide repeat protein [Candidatus Hydrogenedentes bacterium]|nr:tetratricopeptide repeat protein [Candidatus Hydrogenedentota bacterium]
MPCSDVRLHKLALSALAAAIILVFARLALNDFIDLDDHLYVTRNLFVQSGLTPGNLARAFTYTEIGHWHPITWISHMLDCQLFGLNPGAHHCVSLLFHLANSLLLYHVLRRMTGAPGRSLMVAALFALHPFHVEPVASISSRKDLISALFWLLTMLAYLNYTRQPTVRRWLMVAVCLVLGLMAKPMLVTLPLVLLLMDYWPLNRWDTGVNQSQPWRTSRTLLVAEKVPLLILAFLSCAITYHTAQSSGIIRTFHDARLSVRLINGVVSYGTYLFKTIVPHSFAIFYPNPTSIPPAWQVAVSLFVLIAGTATAVLWWRRAPYFFLGWWWFIVSLLPVIGVVQYGTHVQADRYTYIPLIGLFIALTWAIADGWQKRDISERALIALATVLLIGLGLMSVLQVGHWRNAETVYTHALRVTRDNYMAHNNLGTALLERGVTDKAFQHFLSAARLKPDFSPAQFNLGFVFARQGNFDNALAHYERALELSPRDADTHAHLAEALSHLNRHDEALGHYQSAVRLAPSRGDLRCNLGNELARLGRLDEAVTCYREALQLGFRNTLVYYNLGAAFERQSRFEQAIQAYSDALSLQPDFRAAHDRLGALQPKRAQSAPK